MYETPVMNNLTCPVNFFCWRKPEKTHDFQQRVDKLFPCVIKFSTPITCSHFAPLSNSHPQWWEAVMPGHWENHSGSFPESFITSSTEITLQYLVWLEGHLWWPFCSFWLSFAMLLLLAVFLILYSLRQGWSLSAVWRHPLTPLCWHLEMFEISLLHSLIIE